MRRALTFTLIGLLALLTACAQIQPGSGQSVTPPVPGAALHHLTSDGTRRSYWYYHPPSDPTSATPVPLLIVLHGTGSNGAQMIKLGKFAAKADLEKFILVAPNSLGRAFNDGSGRIGQNLKSKDIDDVQFISDIIKQVRDRQPLSAVYVTGFSSGAAMAQRLALELGDQLSGVAAVGGHLWAPLLDEYDTPITPVPMLLVFGNKDPLNPVSGGPVSYGADLTITKPAHMTTARRWAKLFNCSTMITATIKMIHQTSWHSCDKRVPVVLLSIDGLGHYWPGGSVTHYENLPESVVGNYVSSMNATDVIWDFFSRISR